MKPRAIQIDSQGGRLTVDERVSPPNDKHGDVAPTLTLRVGGYVISSLASKRARRNPGLPIEDRPGNTGLEQVDGLRKASSKLERSSLRGVRYAPERRGSRASETAALRFHRATGWSRRSATGSASHTPVQGCLRFVRDSYWRGGSTRGLGFRRGGVRGDEPR
jgi:hypothetical protein